MGLWALGLKRTNLIVAAPFILGFLIASPKLTSFGMFIDGVLYATIARNMAEGLGGFWSPHYTSVIYPTFFEHPPLGVWLLSIFFRVFGDSRYVESFYSLFTWFSVFFLMSKIWQRFHWYGGRWFPALLLLSAPITCWIITYNELEGPLQITAMLSILFIIESMLVESTFARALYAAASGAMIVVGFLIKGPFGFYPIVAPLFIYFTCRNTPLFRLFQVYFWQVVVCLVAVFALYSYPDSNYFFRQYFHIQIELSLTGKREVNNPHFMILLKIMGDALVMFLVVALISFTTTRKIKGEKSGPFLFFLLMALATSLPLVISPKNMSWYLMLSMPFYALALASYYRTPLLLLEERIQKKWRKQTNGILLLCFLTGVGVCIANDSKPRRSKDYYKSFVEEPLVGIESEMATVCPGALYKNWSLVANLMRDYKISLTDKPGMKFLIVEEGRGCDVPVNCSIVREPANRKFDIFECEN